MIYNSYLLHCTLDENELQRFLNFLQAEYTIPENNSGDRFHVQKSSIPMKKGGYLIYGTAHMHTGVVNATLYGQVGFNINLNKFCSTLLFLLNLFLLR